MTMSDQSLQTVPPVDATGADLDTAAPAPQYCGNCQSPLLGDYCYRCGQSEKSMVRSLHLIGADLADLVFNVDSRIFRSMFDLYFRPGFLTTEYFAGRRVRYVTPFRLFFFASLVAFFVVQLNMDFRAMDGVLEMSAGGLDEQELAKAKAAADALQKLKAEENQSERVAGIIGKAETDVKAEIARNDAFQAKLAESAAKRASDEAERALKEVADKGNLPPLVDDIISEARKGNEKAAARELEKKKRREAAAAATGTSADKPENDDIQMFNFPVNGKPWHETDNPVDFTLLPALADARINATMGHMRDNVNAMRHDKSKVAQFLANAWSVFPPTLFFMMPFFALLLKIILIFKRRLYMEHLIVALHSHAFIFQSMLVLTLLTVLQNWLLGTVAWLGTLMGYLVAAAWIWLPLYLFLMQKRVYRQGWFFGVVSFGVIGTCYTVLLSFGLIVAFAVALAAD